MLKLYLITLFTIYCAIGIILIVFYYSYLLIIFASALSCPFAYILAPYIGLNTTEVLSYYDNHMKTLEQLPRQYFL